MDHAASQDLSNDQLKAVFDLLTEMVESGDPQPVLERQTDPQLRPALEALWSQHLEAEKLQFLEKALTVVGELSTGGRDVFQPAQILAGRFAVLRRLGRGGMGEVYLAEDQLLHETVAIKTIKRALARDPLNRERFQAEVRNSRRVTHPNVCRIFDLFEHEGVPFFSMEYVAGPTLAEVGAAGRLDPARAKVIAIQAAEGLHAAHENGILHCDFKPNNIILAGSGKNERTVITDFGLARALGGGGPEQGSQTLAGTPPFMSPELLRGEAATIHTDVYAYGKVMEVLLPGHKLAQRCAARDAAERPESLGAVLKELKGAAVSRRDWIVGFGACAVAGLVAYQRFGTGMASGSRQRVQVNGFTPDLPELAKKTETVRRLLIMALAQSPHLSVLNDQRYRAPNSPEVLEAGFALSTDALLNIARLHGVRLAIDGQLRSKDNGLLLRVTAYYPGNEHPPASIEVAVDDERGVVRLAERAADELRKKVFGEIVRGNSYRPLEAVISKSPAAIEHYFNAVSNYEKHRPEEALNELDMALRLDPDFTLAYNYRALVLLAGGLLESAQASSEKAFASRHGQGTRELNWIEGLYHQITQDFEKAAAAYLKITQEFPDEAFFHRMLAYQRMRQGEYTAGLEESKKAHELDLFSDNNASELVVNLAEAGHWQEALAEAERVEAISGVKRVRFGRWLACMQKGDYPGAWRECQPAESDTPMDSLSRKNSLAPLIMQGRFTEAVGRAKADLAWNTKVKPGEAGQSYEQAVRLFLGNLYWLQDRHQEAAEQAEWLVQMEPLACNLLRLREGLALACNLKEIKLAEKGLESLKTIDGGWPSSHSLGAMNLAKAMIGELEGDPNAGSPFAQAERALPWDPLTLFYVARWHGRRGRPDLQLQALVEFGKHHGKVFKYHFAGLVPLSWIEHAKCLQALSDSVGTLRMYNQVAAIWSTPDAAGCSVIRKALQDRDELLRRRK